MTDPVGIEVDYQDCVGLAEVRVFKPEEGGDEMAVVAFTADWFDLMPPRFIAQLLYSAGDELILMAKEFGPREKEGEAVIKLVQDPGAP